MQFDLYLASKSPRRCELLQQIGVSFQQIDGEIDEEVLAGEHYLDYVKRMALEKARTGKKNIQQHINIPVLGADTMVVINNQILGKPSDKQEAYTQLEKLSGHCHQVISAVALVNQTDSQLKCQISEVQFKKLSKSEIDEYLNNGEYSDKAGSYGIQGRAAKFVKHISGSYSGIMGLPLFETHELLAHFGITARIDRMNS